MHLFHQFTYNLYEYEISYYSGQSVMNGKH